ncbi:hypothetical protein QQ020_15610 [Fulvivirgaceae bacterium BMA12]|uniref:Uncharacterized protein n=1 Tax=Agaribacillus aureus TaxID=3051825 RepID=A0ABT8L925_9BACT|nr:hypothetical protein [Fulvivirgaceae bacterium BMA12]
MKNIEPSNIKFCRFLRSKNPYGSLEGGENEWYLIDDANSICWCIKATGGAGPDNGLVDPPLCVSGRACYEPPVS